MVSPEMQPDSPAFFIVVHEKGGTERREVFRSAELSIGRVQGNDLMLPKGNVSKRHARLLFRDGRFIVTDLNSTNGTYVNRRRIAQATIVREGDRIYIGDFVLRVEPAAGEGLGVAGAEPTLSSLDRERLAGHAKGVDGRPTGESSGHPAGTMPPDAAAADVTGKNVSSPARPTQTAFNPPTRDELPRAATLPAIEELVQGVDVRAGSEPPTGSLRRQALAAVMDRMYEALAPGALDKDVDDRLTLRIEELLESQLEELRQDGVLDEHIPQTELTSDARAELLQYGAVTSLLASEDVTEIVVARYDDVTALRGGQPERVEPAFSSEQSLVRTVTRLCRAAGAAPAAHEVFICRRLGQWAMWAVVAEASPRGVSLVLKRSSAILSTLDRLVADSIVTQEAAAFLEQCVRARVPVLVVGSRASQAPAVAAALGAVDLPGPVIALEDLVDYVPERIGVVRWDPSVLARSAQELARAAAALREARIVAELSSAPALVAVIHAVAAGVEGVLAYAPVSDLDQALTGLPALAATSLVGTAPEAVAQLVANCFDLVVEVGTKDGVARVSRIAEVVAGRELEVRDIFTLRERADGGRGAELKATGIEPTRAGRALRGVARADAEAGNS